MASKIYIGDIGTKIKLNTRVVLTGYTEIKIKFQRPDDSIGEWPATLEDEKYIYYIIQSGDLNQLGTWKVQAFVTLPSWSGSGETAEFEVFDLFR